MTNNPITTAVRRLSAEEGVLVSEADPVVAQQVRAEGDLVVGMAGAMAEEAKMLRRKLVEALEELLDAATSHVVEFDREVDERVGPAHGGGGAA